MFKAVNYDIIVSIRSRRLILIVEVVVVVVVVAVKVMVFEAQTYISIHRGTSPMVEACVRDPRVKTATRCDLCTRPSTALVCAGD